MTKEDWWGLTISNDFMFSKVMRDESLCKEVVELLIGEKVGTVQDFQQEKVINITHDGKSVRLDVYLHDAQQMVNVEMQVSNGDDLPRRSRFYQGLMDLGWLESGQQYKELPRSYLVFICTFDVIGNGKARNGYRTRNDETNEPLEDGLYKIFYNTQGSDVEENLPLKAFLQYVGGKVSQDSLIQRLEQRLNDVKSNIAWREEFMKFEADRQVLAAKERQEGRLEGKLEEKFEVAKKLLQKGQMGLQEIAELTGLTLGEIETMPSHA